MTIINILTIINDNFRRAHKNINDNNQKIFSFIFKKFQRWIGWKNHQNDEEIREEYDTLMRSKYVHPIEHFPDKIDQLFEAAFFLHSSIIISIFSFVRCSL